MSAVPWPTHSELVRDFTIDNLFRTICNDINISNPLTDQVISSECPANLDYISLHNGVLKFIHPQQSISTDEYYWLRDILCSDFGHLMIKSKVELNSDFIMSQLEMLSAAGYPFCVSVGTIKKDVLRKMTIPELIRFFEQYDSVMSATLKDETRPAEKDARLFRPAPISHVIMGIVLFWHQNQALAEYATSSAYTLGLSVPGPGVGGMWRDLYSFSNLFACFDGKQWDAHYPMWMAKLLLDWRCLYLPQSVHPQAEKYYNDAYCGITNIAGVPVNLLGQPSGHFLTSSDNTLGNYLALCLCARRLGVNRSSLLIKCCGDDLIYATTDPSFDPVSVVKCAHAFGVEYESASDSFIPFEECVFVGTHPVFVGGQLQYTYDVEKQLNHLCFKNKRRSLFEYFCKLVSITSLLYFSEVYNLLYESAKLLSLDSELVHKPQVPALLSSIAPQRLYCLYHGYEACGVLRPLRFGYQSGGFHFFPPPVYLNYQPFKIACMESNLLHEKIHPDLPELKDLTLAGRDFVLKRLHPSDAVQDVRGIPTEETVDSATVSYMSTYTVTAPATHDPSKTYDIVASFVEHPTLFGLCQAVGVTVGSAETIATVECINQQVADGTSIPACQAWPTLADKYRCCYMGVTAHMTAPTTANQGVVTCAQVSVEPQGFQSIPAQATDVLGREVRVYPDMLRASRFAFPTLQGVAGAYTGEAKHGAYMPMKFNETSVEYRHSRKTCALATLNAESSLDVTAAWHSKTSLSATPNSPYLTTSKCATASTAGYAVQLPCSDNVGILYFKGIAASATVTFTVRTCFEIIVQPSSPYLPNVHRALIPDAQALKMVHMIGRELPCGFPASYNALGSLLGVIQQIARKVLPVVLPKAGAWLGTLFNSSTGKEIMKNTAAQAAVSAVKAFSGQVHNGTKQARSQPKQPKKQKRPPQPKTKPKPESEYYSGI